MNLDAEGQHRQAVDEKCNGFLVLMQSYQDFALRTLEEVRTHAVVLNDFSIAVNLATLRRFRTAINAFCDGYYYDAAGTLRAVFENTLFLGAVLNGLFWFDELHAFTRDIDFNAETYDAVAKKKHKHNILLDKRVAGAMYGKDSSLSEDEQLHITMFLKLQHLHVHRGESNIMASIVDMEHRRHMPSVEPTFEMAEASLLANTAACAAWSHTRVLQYVSLPSKHAAEWQDQFPVLDDAFRFYLGGWEGPFGTAFTRLIDTSFTFNQATAIAQLTKTKEFKADS